MAKEHFKFEFEEWMAEELIHRDDWKDWYHAMCEILPLWEVDTIERVAGFVAQCGHESAGFRVLSENLNYSAKALNTIFPKYFKRAGRDANDRRYTTLTYANGPGHRDPTKEGVELDLSNTDTEAFDFKQAAAVPLRFETHGGEDVAIYASGPGSQWINGVMEQNVIFHVMNEALLGGK